METPHPHGADPTILGNFYRKGRLYPQWVLATFDDDFASAATGTGLTVTVDIRDEVHRRAAQLRQDFPPLQ